eukprot:sb/3479672/
MLTLQNRSERRKIVDIFPRTSNLLILSKPKAGTCISYMESTVGLRSHNQSSQLRRGIIVISTKTRSFYVSRPETGLNLATRWSKGLKICQNMFKLSFGVITFKLHVITLLPTDHVITFLHVITSTVKAGQIPELNYIPITSVPRRGAGKRPRSLLRFYAPRRWKAPCFTRLFYPTKNSEKNA